MRSYKLKLWGFSGGLVAKSPPVNAGTLMQGLGFNS